MNKKSSKAYKSTKKENPIVNYVKAKGFYIALVSLVAILIVSIFTTSYMKRSENVGNSFDDEAWKAAIAESEKEYAENSEKQQTYSENIPVLTTDVSENSENSKETTDSATDVSSIDENETAVLANAEAIPYTISYQEAESVAEESVAEPDLVMPCLGEISKEFSMDELVYSKTMDDWRTHSGLDITAAIGTQVKAAGDGVVSDVYTDDLLGNVVEIDHGSGIKTLYANLQSADYIEKGHSIKAGDIIGGVGISSSEESSDEPHLHFEVLKNGEPIKPEL